MYWSTDEIDPNTNKVNKHYDEIERKQANPGKPVVEKPTITCPHCQSTDVRKIGTAPLVGVYSLKILYYGIHD